MPPAPPGLIWWDYKDTVPPLPDPGTVNPSFTGYGWRYDPNWRPTTYTFNNMDQAGPPAAANCERGHVHRHTQAGRGLSWTWQCPWWS